jgi:enoyl-CoA hydratase/carnithine racemase
MSRGCPGTRSSLAVEIQGNVARIRLQRSERANALNEATVAGLGEFFADPSALYSLPEGRLGIFVGGEGAVFRSVHAGQAVVRRQIHD